MNASVEANHNAFRWLVRTVDPSEVFSDLVFFFGKVRDMTEREAEEDDRTYDRLDEYHDKIDTLEAEQKLPSLETFVIARDGD